MANEVDSPGRLTALQKTGLLDSPAEPAFDRITNLVRRHLNVDVSLISLVDVDRQFFKSSAGLGSPWAERRETPLSHSFCQHVVRSNGPLIVNDASQHPLVCTNAAVKDLSVMAYLGVPIRSSDGEVLGSLCAIKTRVTEWTNDDKLALQEFAGIVEDAIALRSLAEHANGIANENEMLAREYHHRVKNVLSVAVSLLRMSAKEADSISEAVIATEGRLTSLAEAHDALMERSDDVDLEALLSRILAPYQLSATRTVATNGPPVSLKFKQITPLCLIVHELATNSAKYGAIRNGGALSLTWTAAQGQVLLSWNEDSGLEGGSLPNASGFGSKLLKIAAAQLGGAIALQRTKPLLIGITFPLQ